MRTKKFFCVTALLFIFLAGFVSSSLAGSISGTVWGEDANGVIKPLPNVDVSVHPSVFCDNANIFGYIMNNLGSAVTDDNGEFTIDIDNIPEGEVVVEASPSPNPQFEDGNDVYYVWGFYTENGSFVRNCANATRVSVPDEGNAEIEIILSRGGTITGGVYGPDINAPNDNPLQGVSVNAITPGDLLPSGVARTDENGQYEMHGLPEEVVVCVSLNANPNNYVAGWFNETVPYPLLDWELGNTPAASSIQVKAGGVKSEFDFNLRQGGSISGTVFEEDSVTTISGLLVQVFFANCGSCLVGGSMTDVDGNYEINGIPLGGLSQPFYVYASGIVNIWAKNYSDQYYGSTGSGAERVVLDETSMNKAGFNFYLRETEMLDQDGDGLSYEVESVLGSSDGDADSDDDGISDYDDFWAPTDMCDSDTDNDGIHDGTESGLTLGDIGPDTDTTFFIEDLDPTTTTDPTKDDTDGDGLLDGEEDANHNGKVDIGETDPNVYDGGFEKLASLEVFSPTWGEQVITVSGMGSLLDGTEVFIPALTEITYPEGSGDTITISNVLNPPPMPPDAVAYGVVVEFGPDGTTFDKRVTIKIPYSQYLLDLSGALSPEELEVWTYNTTLNTWEKISVDNVDTENQVLVCSTYHFSIYTATAANVIDAQGPKISNVILSPNPVAVGNFVLLTADVDDTATGGSIITGAEYSVDGGETWILMEAADFSFDRMRESISVVLTSPDAAEVLKILIRGIDDSGNTGDEKESLLVVYDPEGGFVTGGGWIWSPPGACRYDGCLPETTGKANFGFVSKYKKGAKVPTGETKFKFKAGNLNFQSDIYDWLVVAGPKAKYKGVGTINGEGNYGFMITAIDAALTPSTDVDLFRIKIWDRDNNDTIVYDNQMDTDDDADPSTTIGGGSIMIHKAK